MSKKMNEALKVLANHGRVLREAAEDPLTFATHPSEIDSPEDTWASGESIALELDHAHVTHDAEEQVTEPETMKISELRKIIAAGLMLSEMTPAAPGHGAQADQHLKDYQDGYHGGAHVGVEENLEDAAYAMIDMFIELNGVDRHEARQMVIDYVSDFLGRHG